MNGCGAQSIWATRHLGAILIPLDGRKIMRKLIGRLVKDEQGGEVLEYALIAGLIVVAAIAVITSVGGKVLAKWTAVDSGLQ
jgi:pilus assembly protein Flp/PilA